MKNLFLVISIFISTGLSFAQCGQSNSLDYMTAGGGEDYGGYNFKMFGEKSDVLVDALFDEFTAKQKGKKHLWKIKKVAIPGLDQTVTLEIHQGLQSHLENCKVNYTTYTSEEDKQEKLKNQSELEPSVLIYVRNGRKNALKTKEQAKIVREYLLSIYS